MSDGQHIATLLKIASAIPSLQVAQDIAGGRLLKYDGEVYPRDGCAITLSVLLQQAGINIKDTYGALELANLLRDRGWARVPNGQQAPGDIGSTCGPEPEHGVDHVYLVLQPIDDDQMLIADNQQPVPHARYVSGAGGKSPTRYFLRAA